MWIEEEEFKTVQQHLTMTPEEYMGLLEMIALSKDVINLLPHSEYYKNRGFDITLVGDFLKSWLIKREM